MSLFLSCLRAELRRICGNEEDLWLHRAEKQRERKSVLRAQTDSSAAGAPGFSSSGLAAGWQKVELSGVKAPLTSSRGPSTGSRAGDMANMDARRAFSLACALHAPCIG